jgi:two-component sensor histidine kinase
MQNSSSKLTAQNAYLTQMLKQAGLDAQARDVAERIQAVLTDEIHHRMKNMLTMVTAIVRQSMRSAQGLAEAESAISVRLLAMARAHDLLLKADWQSAGLLAVVRGAVEQHDTAATRIVVQGTDLQIPSAAILPLTMILNELCTNATKYGALSDDAGRVEIGWDIAEEALVLRWTEIGGPVNPCCSDRRGCGPENRSSRLTPGRVRGLLAARHCRRRRLASAR